MIAIDKALRLIERESRPLGIERVNIADSIGRVLAENIIADTDLPPFDRSQMDGYAVKADETRNPPVTLKIAGESAAGKGWHKTLRRGEAVRIMTGGTVPKGADAVQKIELTTEDDGYVRILEPTKRGQYIVKKGLEIKKGKTVLTKGEMLSVLNIALPAAFGYAKVRVSRRPRVAVFSTGSEIVEIAKKPMRDQIRNTNSLMLANLCQAAGAGVQLYPIIRDDISDLKSKISDAAKSSDILITTGGVSVGKYDLTKLAIQELGATLFFERVALKPGKPTVFARLGRTLVFGLPGNPVSAAVMFMLFVRKAILGMQSAASTDLRDGFGRLRTAVKSAKERDSYLPAIVAASEDGSVAVTPKGWKGSSDIVGFSRADALIIVPKGMGFDVEDVVKILYF